MLLGFPQDACCQKKPVPVDIKSPLPPLGGVHRSPVLYPEVFIEDYILSFDENSIGCPITLIDADENTVFTTIIDETGVVELPNDLVGIFELELVRDSITFVGEIEL